MSALNIPYQSKILNESEVSFQRSNILKRPTLCYERLFEIPSIDNVKMKQDTVYKRQVQKVEYTNFQNRITYSCHPVVLWKKHRVLKRSLFEISSKQSKIPLTLRLYILSAESEPLFGKSEIMVFLK